MAGLGRSIRCANLYNCYDQQLYTNHDDASVSSHVRDGTTTKSTNHMDGMNGGTPKFSILMDFHYKPSIWGTPISGNLHIHPDTTKTEDQTMSWGRDHAGKLGRALNRKNGPLEVGMASTESFETCEAKFFNPLFHLVFF